MSAKWTQSYKVDDEYVWWWIMFYYCVCQPCLHSCCPTTSTAQRESCCFSRLAAPCLRTSIQYLKNSMRLLRCNIKGIVFVLSHLYWMLKRIRKLSCSTEHPNLFGIEVIHKLPWNPHELLQFCRLHNGIYNFIIFLIFPSFLKKSLALWFPF